MCRIRQCFRCRWDILSQSSGGMEFRLGVTGNIVSSGASSLGSRSAAGFSSVMFSSLSLGVECCVSVVVVLCFVSCCCGSSIGCCGGSVWKCVCVVLGVSGAWAGGGAGVPSRCFLWWSGVSICACCLIAWGLWLRLVFHIRLAVEEEPRMKQKATCVLS